VPDSNNGQLASKSLISENTPRAVAGVGGFCAPPTLDKMMRDRKHLVSAELEKLLAAVKGTRHEARDHCLLLLMFQHGLRASEACKLRLSQVDTDSRILHVTRLKDRLSTTHPLKGVPRGRPHVLNSAWQLALSELASDSRAGLTPQIGKGSRGHVCPCAMTRGSSRQFAFLKDSGNRCLDIMTSDGSADLRCHRG
jgi:integrase